MKRKQIVLTVAGERKVQGNMRIEDMIKTVDYFEIEMKKRNRVPQWIKNLLWTIVFYVVLMGMLWVANTPWLK